MHSYRNYVAACCRGTTIAALMAVGPAASHVQTALHFDVPGSTGALLLMRSTLGAHTLLAQSEGMGASPAITHPVTTQTSGSSLIVFNGGYAGNTTPPVDSYSNRWKQLGRPVTYGNGYGGFDVKAYIAQSVKGGANHTVSIVKNANAAGEISIPFIEVRQAILHDVAQSYAATGPVLTSDSVTTTGPATLIAVWWGDGGVTRMTAVPNNGFSVIDSFLRLPDNSGVQCAVAYRQVDTAGTYNVSWLGAPLQGAILWLFAFQSKNE